MALNVRMGRRWIHLAWRWYSAGWIEPAVALATAMEIKGDGGDVVSFGRVVKVGRVEEEVAIVETPMEMKGGGDEGDEFGGGGKTTLSGDGTSSSAVLSPVYSISMRWRSCAISSMVVNVKSVVESVREDDENEAGGVYGGGSNGGR